MKLLFDLSQLLYEDAETLTHKAPEYTHLKSLEGRLFENVPEELRTKLIDVQSEIKCHTLLNCFLYGVQLGFAASQLGQSG